MRAASSGSRAETFAVESFVTDRVVRSTCTAARVAVQYDPELVSSFHDRKATSRNATSATYPLYRLRVTVVGAAGNLGMGVVKACRGNPLIESVTAVVRDDTVARPALLKMFDAGAEVEEKQRKGYKVLSPVGGDGGGASPTIRVVQADVRDWSESQLTEKRLKEQADLAAAVASSDVVFNCAAGYAESGNTADDVEWRGGLQVAQLASFCDAQYVFFTHCHNRRYTPGFWNMHFWTFVERPTLFRSERKLERCFLSDRGEVFADCRRAWYNPLQLLVRWPELPSFPGDFRWSNYRLSGLLPARMSSGYEMLFNDNLECYFHRSPDKLSPSVAGLLFLRAVTTSRAHWQHRVDVAGRSSKAEGIPTQLFMDSELDRPPANTYRQL